ncbi:poly [ADP-ribose] polymerase 2-like isoform X3 [Halichondria panicea]|uniref:poly [ADP-ribose] polymerase 2-like isoform X3 n=1 Tax=Halichondria panicea TaxID=6063 RepID=UPI00312B3FAB
MMMDFLTGAFIVVCDQVGLGRLSQEALFIRWHFLFSSLLSLHRRSLLMVCSLLSQCQGVSHAQYCVCLVSTAGSLNNRHSLTYNVCKAKLTYRYLEPSAIKKKSNIETEEAAVKPTPKARKASSSKSSASKSSGAKSSGKAKEEDSNGRVIVATKGEVPVDYACTTKVGKASVYSEGGVHWDAMLNQTNLKNNNNKFYIMQLLQESGTRGAQYSVWFRWGRVGKTGQNSLQPCGGDLEQAKDLFRKKFADKTNNSWEDRDSFVKVTGKYDLLKIDYEAKDEVDGGEEVDGVSGEGSSEDLKPVESKLDPKVQSLVQLICNVKAMEDIVVEMKYDAEKAPLGKLTTNQIRLGYAALKKIEDCINKSDFGDRLYKACDEFYTRIPHCFGMQRPPVIKTKEMVKEKIALLEALGDIQIAMKVLSSGDASKEHPVDRHYSELKCQLAPVDTEDSVFALVEKYMRQTHAGTHNQYTMQLLDLFSVEREGEAEQFTDKGNRKLLWHGSRITNWVGILSQGLRIAPPEAPVTGYMFGKGLYFADMSSKSANYCFASKAKNEGFILLCDVSLGNTHDLLAAEYNADELVKGRRAHSVMGLGRIAPNPSMDHTLSDGCVVPLGTSVDTGVSNPRGYTLNYNEYIVYDVKQVKMRYLAKVKFNFK